MTNSSWMFGACLLLLGVAMATPIMKFPPKAQFEHKKSHHAIESQEAEGSAASAAMEMEASDTPGRQQELYQKAPGSMLNSYDRNFNKDDRWSRDNRWSRDDRDSRRRWRDDDYDYDNGPFRSRYSLESSYAPHLGRTALSQQSDISDLWVQLMNNNFRLYNAPNYDRRYW